MPLWFAAICYNHSKVDNEIEHFASEILPTAFKSLSTSLMFLHPELPGYLAGFSTMSSYSPFLSNIPPLTILKLTISAPSSIIFTDVGGIEPGKIPPTSAWWPLDAVKNIIPSLLESKTGVISVISGKCLPSDYKIKITIM